MIRKLFLILVLFSFGQNILADEIPVNIKPINKITTSNINLQEGDSVSFAIQEDIFVNSKLFIKKGTPVNGTIISIENNDYLYKPATLYADKFVTQDVNGQRVKLKGIIYKKGNDHWMITQFILFPLTILRGGEVQIKPEKDIFTLILEGDK